MLSIEAFPIIPLLHALFYSFCAGPSHKRIWAGCVHIFLFCPTSFFSNPELEKVFNVPRIPSLHLLNAPQTIKFDPKVHRYSKKESFL